MTPQLEQIPITPDRSFVVTQVDLPEFDAPWHFHPEYELTLIEEGTGTRFVGDSIEPFAAGDCVLLGPNLPHHWRSATSSGRSRAVVIQFAERAIPRVPELADLTALLQQSARGLRFLDKNSLAFDGTYLGFLVRLAALAREPSQPLTENADPKTSERLTRACDFILRNLRRPISLGDVARAAAMSDAAFSRYFKKHTGKALTQFIAEQRIADAARQLLETDRGVSEIAFDTGFGSLSAFNRHFLAQRGISPRAFRASGRGNESPGTRRAPRPASRTTPRADSVPRDETA